jgi:hypothetical protein
MADPWWEAHQVAKEAGVSWVGTDMLLVGLTRSEGIAREVLAAAGVTDDAIASRVIEANRLAARPPAPDPDAPPRPTPAAEQALGRADGFAVGLGIADRSASLLLALLYDRTGIHSGRSLSRASGAVKTFRSDSPADAEGEPRSVKSAPHDEFRRCLDLLWIARPGQPREAERVILVTRDHVQVEVEDGLPGGRSVEVGQVHAVSAERIAGAHSDPLRGARDRCEVLGTDVVDVTRVDAWDDECVPARHRIDVHERHGALVRVDDRPG